MRAVIRGNARQTSAEGAPLSDVRRSVINYPNVVAEAFDGEWVIVHLGSGTYFSLDGSAAILWPLVISGATREEVVVQARATFPDARADLTVDVLRFYDELQSHDLITDSSEQVSDVVASPVQEEYAPPRIGVHADLQDILLLDPVHDVDAAGWPVAATDMKSSD